MRFLIVGDVVGHVGVDMITDNVPRIIKEEKIDFCIINGENSAEGKGIQVPEMKAIYASGADVITMGNHIYYRKEFYPYYKSEETLLIPANITNLEGHGSCIVEKNGIKVGCINLIGIVGMGDITVNYSLDPFETAKKEAKKLKNAGCKYIFLDFHAEATAEKRALAYYLQEDITCLFGTHTHVQTADEEILDTGLAFISDVGMTGPADSVIGLKKEIAVRRFVTGEKVRYQCSHSKPQFNGIIVETNDENMKCVEIKRLNFKKK
ncbi:MAG: TIGR00282 family metallophosphoesterase [Clostridia bacterium]